MTNFTNGALVLRVWRFDGTSELLAKFQYFNDAKAFGELCFNRDVEHKAKIANYFYLAICEHECAVQAFGVKAGGVDG